MVIRTALASILGLVAGAAGAIFLVFGPVEIGGVKAGPWRSNELIGDPDAGPVLRAVVARRGLLALNRSETVYFTAWEDSSGDRLDEACDYRISGGPLPARWWSLTLYADDDFLARNGTNAHAATMTDLGAGDWQLTAGPRPRPDEAWLATTNAGNFSITLRLYHPEPVVLDAPGSIDFPVIDRVGCGEDA